MRFSEAASAFLLEHLQKKGAPGIILHANGQGCHMRIGMDYGVGNGEIIDGIQVEMDEETKVCLEHILVDRKDNQLIFMLEHGCSGCNSDCNSEC